MSRRDGASDLVRIVRGVRGRVDDAHRTGGALRLWLRRALGRRARTDGRLQFTAGPDRLLLDTSAPMRGEDLRTVGDFTFAQAKKSPSS